MADTGETARLRARFWLTLNIDGVVCKCNRTQFIMASTAIRDEKASIGDLPAEIHKQIQLRAQIIETLYDGDIEHPSAARLIDETTNIIAATPEILSGERDHAQE